MATIGFQAPGLWLRSPDRNRSTADSRVYTARVPGAGHDVDARVLVLRPRRWLLLGSRHLGYGSGAQIGIAPPPIPVYTQPECPGPGMMWTPGYWSYDPDDGYYWVPGTWVMAPEPRSESLHRRFPCIHSQSARGRA